MATVLRDAGWSTFWVGKNHNTPVDAWTMGSSKKLWPLGLGVALEHPERRREGHRPARRVVVVAIGPAELVQEGQVVLDLVRPRIEDLFSLTEPFGLPSPDAPLSAH
jgi:hypothetical protein